MPLKKNINIKPSWKKPHNIVKEVYTPSSLPVEKQEYIKASLHTEKLKFVMLPRAIIYI